MVRTKIWQWCPYHILTSSVIYFWADHRNMESICFIWWKSKTLLEAKMWKNTTPFMTQTNNYAHAIMKQKKTKTDYLSGLSVFVFIVNKLGPFEKPFHKLKLRVHQDFQTLENNKSIRPSASCFPQFSRVWKPWWNTRPRLWNISSYLLLNLSTLRGNVSGSPSPFAITFLSSSSI